MIDLEVENHTASPTVDPSVHVFLVGHSMGGILAGDLLLLLAAEQPINDNLSESKDDQVPPLGQIMFPHIQGVLAFDTPFLGIAPGVFSYGAEGHYRTASSAYNSLSEVAGFFGYGKNNSGAAAAAKEPPKPLPSDDAAATPWQRWGRYAIFAGAAGAAVAASGAALYSQRQNLSAGVNWVSSHLEFVGCLTRGSELRKRLSGLTSVQQDRGIQCVNFYTCLGNGASSLVENTGGGSFSQKIIRAKNRTFCTLPSEVEKEDIATSEQPGLHWTKAVNHQAVDEVKAHTTMFLPRENPAFFDLVGDACKAVVTSIDKDWYKSSTAPDEGAEPSHQDTEAKDDFTDSDDVVVVD